MKRENNLLLCFFCFTCGQAPSLLSGVTSNVWRKHPSSARQRTSPLSACVCARETRVSGFIYPDHPHPSLPGPVSVSKSALAPHEVVWVRWVCPRATFSAVPTKVWLSPRLLFTDCSNWPTDRLLLIGPQHIVSRHLKGLSNSGKKPNFEFPLIPRPATDSSHHAGLVRPWRLQRMSQSAPGDRNTTQIGPVQ